MPGMGAAGAGGSDRWATGGGAGAAGSFASSAAKRCLGTACCLAASSARTQASSPSAVQSGNHPQATIASTPPEQPATFLVKTALDIFIRRNFSSAGLFSTFSVIFSSVCSATRRTSTGADAMSCRAASSSWLLEATAADGAAAAAGAPTLPNGFSAEPPPPAFERMLRSMVSIIARSDCPCGVESASSAMLTIHEGMPWPSRRNFATASA
mmetsp:Transcript_107146/g.320439  ORF Transcript_107146/g.320439 Transcript_107146/m.320439 type:complete len:211 (+) Transcript_107146:277-909(+)